MPRGLLMPGRAGSGGAEVVAEPGDGLDPHEGSGVRGVDHPALSQGDPDVVDMGAVLAEEDQVARGCFGAGRQQRFGVVLGLGGAGQDGAGAVVGVLDQAAAVESGRALTAPQVGGADLP